MGQVGKAFAPLLPGALKPMLELLPAHLPPKQSWPEVTPARGERRARVALLAGCAQQVLDPDINTATIEVLTRNGVEVLVPRAQGCCGGLTWTRFSPTRRAAAPRCTNIISFCAARQRRPGRNNSASGSWM
jgi:glycolate oxidase iron-sulfur subunit